MANDQRFKFYKNSEDKFLNLFGPYTWQTLYLERYIEATTGNGGGNDHSGVLDRCRNRIEFY